MASLFTTAVGNTYHTAANMALGDNNYQGLAQQQNTLNQWASQSYVGYNYQTGVYSQLTGVGASVPPPVRDDEPTCDFHLGPCSKVHRQRKKLSRAIEKLRAEITAWHGDVLERCAA